jgi:hypothetical protein
MRGTSLKRPIEPLLWVSDDVSVNLLHVYIDSNINRPFPRISWAELVITHDRLQLAS